MSMSATTGSTFGWERHSIVVRLLRVWEEFVQVGVGEDDDVAAV